jgi:hypothetical protein
VNDERFIIYVTDAETIRLAVGSMKGKNNIFPMEGWGVEMVSSTSPELAPEARHCEAGRGQRRALRRSA